jgi:hypothetical protein
VRQLLVFGPKTFRITIPDEAKITFGPFSPPSRDTGNWVSSGKAEGTLRVYLKSKDNIIACFVGVRGFRDLSLEYEEQIAVEEGASIWKSDKDGYQREEKVKGSRQWVRPVLEIEEEAT